jgi:fructose-bisphosphate aldolase class I
MEKKQAQKKKVTNASGFIAALDQSGGSTPKALNLYGIETGSWIDETEMFDLVHQMRSRIIKSRSFSGDKILGAILFEQTMERKVEDLHTADFLWEKKKIVPFLKVDKGLEESLGGMQFMKPILDLDDVLAKASSFGIFGTKMRSVVHTADLAGIAEIVFQQFDVGRRILDSNLIPIIEPEIDIHCSDKTEAESILRGCLLEELGQLDSEEVILKLTLPEDKDFYRELISHPRVMRVVALSGGYPRDEANRRLLNQKAMIASFSRALTEGLSVNLSEESFNDVLAQSIESIFRASVA